MVRLGDDRRGFARSCCARTALIALLAVATLPCDRAHAQTHAIGPGHESAVLEFFRPYALGDEIEGGFRLADVSIEPTRIAVTIRRADGIAGVLFLQHRDDSPSDAPSSESFVLVSDSPLDDAARAPIAALIAAVRRNDAGGFWGDASVTIDGAETGPASSLRRAALWGGDTDWVPIDGIAVLLLILVLGVLLAARALRDAPRWMAATLAAIVGAGAILRLSLAPATFLGAWPWTRLYPNARAVVHGHWLTAIADGAGETLYVTDATLWTNFAYAALMPLVGFSHATYLLRHPRAGLFAAFVIAFLPQHIRYSRCEDGFVASLVLTSLAFALIHGWLRDPSRVVRGLLLLALPAVVYPGYLLRPLNILFVVVYVAALLFLHVETAPRWRRGVGLAVVLGVGLAALVQFLERNAESASASVGPHVLLEAFRVLLSPTLLVVSDPTRTPPVLIVLALGGGWLAWKAGERRLVAFLGGWLLLFVVAHAVVVQESMQPRYHLHLVVPFVLLAALAVVHAKREWLDDRNKRLLGAGAMASLMAAPWLHGAFIADVNYTEMHEYSFVREARDEVPAGCMVLEWVGGDASSVGAGSRFARIGAYASVHRETRFDVVPVYSDGETLAGTPTLEELAADVPECLYVYEGIACRTAAGTGADRHACVALRERFGADVVRETEAPVRLYDSATDPDGALADEPTITLRLARATAR